MNNLKKTYPAYDNWLSKNMVELRKAVDHIPMEETSDIIEVAGRLIWLAAQQQEGYAMVPVEPSLETMQKMKREFIDSEFDTPKRRMQQVYKAMIQEAQE